MLNRQRGVLNLFWVAVFSAVFAGVAMAALFSMRYERNIFAEGMAKVGKLVGSSGASQVMDSATDSLKGATGQPDGALRKCVINGKTVVSNTECTRNNPTSKKLQNHDTRGIEAPKVPPKAAPSPGSNPAIDKILEKQLN